MKPTKPFKVSIDFPRKVEGFLVGGMVFLLFLIDITQNKLQDFGLDYKVSLYANHLIPAITVFWIALLVYNIFLVLIVLRSIWVKRMNFKLDLLFGLIIFIGFSIIIIGAIGAFFFKAPQPITWLFNFPQITFYHIGMLMEVIGGLYFSITK